jgi:hypothetical protein
MPRHPPASELRSALRDLQIRCEQAKRLSSGVGSSIGLAMASLGTETDGSILSPSSVNNLVRIKPSVGLTSRSLVIRVFVRLSPIDVSHPIIQRTLSCEGCRNSPWQVTGKSRDEAPEQHVYLERFGAAVRRCVAKGACGEGCWGGGGVSKITHFRNPPSQSAHFPKKQG